MPLRKQSTSGSRHSKRTQASAGTKLKRSLAAVSVCAAIAPEVSSVAAAEANSVHKTDSSAPGRGASGQYFKIEQNGTSITSLMPDATGFGNFTTDLVAPKGFIGPIKSARLDGAKLTIEPAAKQFSWELPFVREGYYDAEAHVNYPSPYTTAGATPLVLPIRKFVTSSGQSAFIEQYKRLHKGRYFLNLNVANGSQVLLCGDVSLNFDLRVTFPDETVIENEVEDDRLRLVATSIEKPVVIEVLPRGAEQTPESRVTHPTIRFTPDFLVKFDATGKQASASALATDFVRQAIYFAPRQNIVGDWGMSATETHLLDDPRSWHLTSLRKELVQNLALVGYDRFEHFGLKYAWGRLPDYGAGGLLNYASGNAPYDMRMLHLNGLWVQTLASYVLATGDVEILKARSARWVSTDGAEPQPICGLGTAKGDASGLYNDFVLAAGDVRLDKKTPKLTHSLGQSFEAKAPFQSVTIRLGAEGPRKSAKTADHGTSYATGIASVRRTPDGEDIVKQPFKIEAGIADYPLTITLPQRLDPGKYHVRITDDNSGKQYFGVGVFWLTDPMSDYAGGDAYSGPFHGTVFDKLVLLIEYMRKYMGAENGDLAYFINDPEYNIPDHKSGRHRVCTQNSYHEGPGGGYDAWTGMWYNAGCRALAELATLTKRDDLAKKYSEYATRADDAYNKKYWHTVQENGQNFSRYYGCLDWDGNIHDYGFTYYNLEASARGIPHPDQVRDILRWLDRGFYTPTGDADPAKRTGWRKHIYSPWQIVTPFNSIESSSWQNCTGILPYLEVLTNGGARTIWGGYDLRLRASILSIDNMHERNKQVLARLANPDRLTGGRTFPDPGGRGRWHFGEPMNDCADIEAFREIFQVDGVMGPGIPEAYLGMKHTAKGLVLRPRVPSDLTSMAFEGIGYSGAVLNFVATAARDDVATKSVEAAGENAVVFVPSARFNKVALAASVKPFKIRDNAQVDLTLEQQTASGSWEKIATTWYNHVQDGAWQWIAVDKWLEPGTKYRLTAGGLDAPEGEKISLMTSDGIPLVRIVAETTDLRITPTYNPGNRTFRLTGATTEQALQNNQLGAKLEPSQEVLLASELFQ